MPIFPNYIRDSVGHFSLTNDHKPDDEGLTQLIVHLLQRRTTTNIDLSTLQDLEHCMRSLTFSLFTTTAGIGLFNLKITEK